MQNRAPCRALSPGSRARADGSPRVRRCRQAPGWFTSTLGRFTGALRCSNGSRTRSGGSRALERLAHARGRFTGSPVMTRPCVRARARTGGSRAHSGDSPARSGFEALRWFTGARTARTRARAERTRMVRACSGGAAGPRRTGQRRPGPRARVPPPDRPGGVPADGGPYRAPARPAVPDRCRSRRAGIPPAAGRNPPPPVRHARRGGPTGRRRSEHAPEHQGGRPGQQVDLLGRQRGVALAPDPPGDLARVGHGQPFTAQHAAPRLDLRAVHGEHRGDGDVQAGLLAQHLGERAALMRSFAMDVPYFSPKNSRSPYLAT